MTGTEPIRTEADYDNALAEVGRLWGARSGTSEGDRLNVLATLIDTYESEHDPIDSPEKKSGQGFYFRSGNFCSQ
ncbi:MAG: helix-turn-helix domain-containing protein [Stellaceae bacterium]